jgi:hypothetical protein
MDLPRRRHPEGYLMLDDNLRDAVELLDLALTRTRASSNPDVRLKAEICRVLEDARERLLAVAEGESEVPAAVAR